mgnify:CR=1 FL=1
MSIDFSDYVQCLDENDHEHAEALHSSYHEAQRVMSPRGLDNYLQGMRAMCTLNRGQDLVLTYVQEMPGVAREVGEDIIPDIVEAFVERNADLMSSEARRAATKRPGDTTCSRPRRPPP